VAASAAEPDDEPGPDPLAVAEHWLAQAQAAGVEQADAMTLATADARGRPSARAVLLKAVDARGFSFFTNYESRKARELDANPRAALVLLWVALHRQVRAAGAVVKLTAEESDAYFATRPRGSQLAAWASEQSRPLTHRSLLDERWEALEARFAGGAVPRPPHWGGYRVEPDEIELWLGRANRMHDRFAYTRAAAGGWERTRLQP
jgi:pyridoxamine 5'-phosphate oxidase